MHRYGIWLPMASATVLLVLAGLLQLSPSLPTPSSPHGAAGHVAAGCRAEPPVVLLPAALRAALPLPAGDRASGPDRLTDAVVADRFVFELRPGAVAAGEGLPPDVARALADLGATDVRRVYRRVPLSSPPAGHLGLARTFRFASGAGLEEVTSDLERVPQVEWVGPDVELKMASGSGERVPGPPSAYWNLAQLRATTTRGAIADKRAIVAVVDSGVGPLDDLSILPGWSPVDGSDDTRDRHGHGSALASVIATTAGPGAAILPVRVVDDGGSAAGSVVAEGIVWAVDHGAAVVLVGVAGPLGSPALDDAVDYAADNGVLVVAPSGNDGYVHFVGHPAAHPAALAIGGTDQDGEQARYANGGPELDLVAPGGDLTVDRTGDGLADGIIAARPDGWWLGEGTSLAAAHVAGVAALLHEAGTNDGARLRSALVATAVDIGSPGFDHGTGYGLVDASSALAWTPAPAAEPLEIREVGTTRVGATRAVVRWTTNHPASSRAEGRAGVLLDDPARVTVHKVVVAGSPGEEVVLTLHSKGPEGTVTRQLAVSF